MTERSELEKQIGEMPNTIAYATLDKLKKPIPNYYKLGLQRQLQAAETLAGNYLDLVSDGVEEIDPISLALLLNRMEEKISDLEYEVRSLKNSSTNCFDC